MSYLRVSTGRQGRSGLGLEAQRKAVDDFLNGGDGNVVKEFVEVESRRTSPRRRRRRAAGRSTGSAAVGQWPAAAQFRQLVAGPDRQHTRHVHGSGVDERWRRPRLGLRHQHARLPAANAVAATQPRNHDRQHYRSHAVALTLPASRRDAITMARKQIPGAALLSLPCLASRMAKLATPPAPPWMRMVSPR